MQPLITTCVACISNQYNSCGEKKISSLLCVKILNAGWYFRGTPLLQSKFYLLFFSSYPLWAFFIFWLLRATSINTPWLRDSWLYGPFPARMAPGNLGVLTDVKSFCWCAAFLKWGWWISEKWPSLRVGGWSSSLQCCMPACTFSLARRRLRLPPAP